MRDRQAAIAGAVLRAGGSAQRVAIVAACVTAWLDRLPPWRARGCALLLGALAALALPPIYAVPVLLVSFSGLVLLMDRTPRFMAAVGLGWCFAFGYFVAGIYWVANALLAVSSAFGWLLPLAIAGAVGGLSALLAAFPAVAVGVARLFWPAGPARILILSISWTIFEWLRGWVLSGFPWNLVGYSWAFSDGMNQFAALGGVWGLSLVTVAVAALPALFLDWTGSTASRDAATTRIRAAAVCSVSGILILAAIWAGGWLRLSGAGDDVVPGVRLRLVQANIDPAKKGDANYGEDVLMRHLDLTTKRPGYDRVTHAIWPETANPFPLELYPDVRMALAGAAPASGAVITGVLRTDTANGRLKEIWNSLAAVDRTGQVVGTYDKFHLVPFGEYVPLHRYLPFVSKFTPGVLDFSAGPGPQTLRLPGLPPVGPLICYEVIFPGQVLDRADRPEWLLNLTNDGWYGISTGPYQHFASARLRAVEEGLPVIRVANTGVSGAIDAYGRVREQIALGESDFKDVELPRALPQLTPYARWGDAAAGVLLAILSLVAVALCRWK
jgi:apolipoprotein N-acyltransferase